MDVPKDNRVYKERSYWNTRFENEEEYEWLVSYEAVKEHLGAHCKGDQDALVVGCGNSNFSKCLVEDQKVKSLVSIDFSETVIDSMRLKYPELNWEVMDMTNMTFDEGRFDLVIDKAAMDALVTDEGDPWNPNEETKKSTGNMMSSVAKVLKPGGKFIQISFQQPHFRKKFLLNPALSDVEVETIDSGLGYFFYVQTRN
mmetsp:Transcript_17328/g.27969  ORF Transcript_17328/g.27969 Transcript_17328/m.27969 type:complete len:199 (-) Transcript_17328:664-1260(-)